MDSLLMCATCVRGQLRTVSRPVDLRRQLERKKERERERKEAQQMCPTWHRRSVRSGRGRRSAVSNPLCPPPWTWRSTAPSLPNDTTGHDNGEPIRAQEFMTAEDSCADELAAFKGNCSNFPRDTQREGFLRAGSIIEDYNSFPYCCC